MLNGVGKCLAGILILTSFLFGTPNKSYCLEDKIENKKEEKISKRNFKIDETFILTDKTRANTFRITSNKEWERYKDEVLISWDLLGQENTTGKFFFAKQRIDLGYKLYTNTDDKTSKTPFFEYAYSSDKPTKVNWKTFTIGAMEKFGGWKVDIGGGYFWGDRKDVDKHYVMTLNFNNEKKIFNLTLKQNLKNIFPQGGTPRIYDYMSSLSVPINKNLNFNTNFDWRYQKSPKVKKEDWFNYTVKVGLTFIPRK